MIDREINFLKLGRVSLRKDWKGILILGCMVGFIFYTHTV